MTQTETVPQDTEPQSRVRQKTAEYEMAEPQFWLNHFKRNRQDRPEPEWGAPLAMKEDAIRILVKSLEQYQLGDGGGPASLIAWNAKRFRESSDECRELVDLWFTEEKEHSRLLGKAVARLGGTEIKEHWSFSVFCGVRRCIGVDFELTVLLLTEIVSTIYDRLMQRHCIDEPIQTMCSLIMRDEAGHMAFHRARMALEGRNGKYSYTRLWELTFLSLGLAAATMLWVNHAKALCALGATTQEFYGEIQREINRFIEDLHRETYKSRAAHYAAGPRSPAPNATMT